jgi:hypothetical protein
MLADRNPAQGGDPFALTGSFFPVSQSGDIQRPRSFRNFREKRYWELNDAGWDIRSNPHDYVYWDVIPKKEDWYHIPTLRKVVSLARMEGVPDRDIIAIAMEETHGGLKNFLNPLHADKKIYGDYPAREESEAWRYIEEHPDEFKTEDAKLHYVLDRIQTGWIKAGLAQYKYARSKAKEYGLDEEAMFQLYSGRGEKIYTDLTPEERRMMGYGTHAFGRPISSIHFWRDKPQAKRKMAIRARLDTFPGLSRVLESE